MRGNLLYLAQTDTTVGFLSQDSMLLDQAKQRTPDKHYIKAVDSLATAKELGRVPAHCRRMLRRGKSTFILPNRESFRIIKEEKHREFVERFGWIFTTSANLSGKSFDATFAKEVADVTLLSREDFEERASSTIIYIGKRRIKKIR